MENSLCYNNSYSRWKQAVRAWQQQREIHGLIYLCRDLPKPSLRAYWFPSACFLSSTPSAQELLSTERPAWALFLCLLQRHLSHARPSPVKQSPGKRRSKFADINHQEDVRILTYVSSKGKDQIRVSSDTESFRHIRVAAVQTSQNSWEQFTAFLMNLGYCR